MFSHNRLAQSLFSKIILASLAISFFIGAVSFYSSLSRYNERQHNEINRLLDSLLPNVSYLVSRQDEKLTETLVSGLLQHPSVEKIILTDMNNQLLLSLKNSSDCTPHPLEQKFIPSADIFVRNLMQGQQELGKIIIQSNHCLAIKNLYQSLSLFSIYILAFSSIISFFISLVLYRTVARPISRFVRTIDAIKIEDISDLDIKKLQSKRTDEMGIAINQFANLLMKVKYELALRQQNELTIQEYSQRLEKLINKRTTILANLNQQLQESLKKADFDLLLKQYYFELASAAAEPIESLMQRFADQPEISTQLMRFNQIRTYASILSNEDRENTAELVNLQEIVL